MPRWWPIQPTRIRSRDTKSYVVGLVFVLAMTSPAPRKLRRARVFLPRV